jgi:hypothetical protein
VASLKPSDVVNTNASKRFRSNNQPEDSELIGKTHAFRERKQNEHFRLGVAFNVIYRLMISFYLCLHTALLEALSRSAGNHNASLSFIQLLVVQPASLVRTIPTQGMGNSWGSHAQGVIQNSSVEMFNFFAPFDTINLP